MIETPNTEVFRVRRDSVTYEAQIESDITLNDYKRSMLAEDWHLLEKYAQRLAGKTIVFINPTMQGGGVAILRPPLIHMLRQFGVDAHWYVMAAELDEGGNNPFEFTKLMHNISQRRTDERITENGKQIHENWCRVNAAVLTQQKAIRQADIIVIDDPQPAPLKKYIYEVNPTAKWVWRNHIDTNHDLMSDPTTPQGEVANYIMKECGIEDVDAVIAHPVEAFVHPGMENKTYFAPATIDLFDDLNKELTSQEVNDGLAFINYEINFKNKEFTKEEYLYTIDPSRPRIAMVARFDESKGMDIAMEIGVQAYHLMQANGKTGKKLPQIVIVGNGSVDDPSGVPIFESMLELRRTKYSAEKNDIILMRLSHNYNAMNALMYYGFNVSSSEETPGIVGLQTSLAEGCETRITDWIRHGVPVVVANRGGMPLQVKTGESGIIIDFSRSDYDIERAAAWIAELLQDTERYHALRQRTLRTSKIFNEREYVTAANATRLCRVFYNILHTIRADRVWLMSDLVAKDTIPNI